MEEFINDFTVGFNGTAASDWATALCFVAIPVVWYCWAR